jgi:hypothetical protein
MAKERKYCKMGDTPVRYECTKKKCKWQGTANEKGSKRVSSIESQLVCPNCGNEEFYGLLK